MASLTMASSLARPSTAAPLRQQVRTQRAARPIVRRQVVAEGLEVPGTPDFLKPKEVELPTPPGPAAKPTQEPDFAPAGYGWNQNAEILNSRYAMLGFFALLALEAATGKGIFELVGIDVGNGIDIGF